MNPDAAKIWQAPRWALAILLAMLGMLGPFSIDTYLPAFAAIAGSLQATPVEMQQTLSAYLFGFAFMNLFHGALSDSFGRRPVILGGLVVFTLASLGCALSQTVGHLIFFRALQGLSTGAGVVVSRAVIRDMFPPSEAQRVMSQVTIFFGVAPAIAPMMGGVLSEYLGWHAIFWFLVAVGVVLIVANLRLLPESLHVKDRQPFQFGHLLKGYAVLLSDPRFFLLALASGVPFNGLFLYILGAPAYLGEVLHLKPTQFFWFFALNIGGIMIGSWLSGRMAGRVAPKNQIMQGFRIMVAVSIVNIIANALFEAEVWWSLWPIALFAFGWALMVPVVTLLVLDLHPDRRGMASSLQSVVGSVANGIVAGAVAPLVMHSALGMAIMSAAFLFVGLLSWLWLHQRWPEIGNPRHPQAAPGQRPG
ncbi:MAG: multidrug effflux MFS transporter [Burkholderiaceae bacterium]|jgi:DHA1 family bicyclomycin/chloramphenicol resistance-like MFS transporter|nr:multidrug effflux MFS transporter [Burkholderiaceae bacterium]MCP5219173.1 multidrug effflux MFS transporter [Burkholderiaceae bacterium]